MTDLIACRDHKLVLPEGKGPPDPHCVGCWKETVAATQSQLAWMTGERDRFFDAFSMRIDEVNAAKARADECEKEFARQLEWLVGKQTKPLQDRINDLETKLVWFERRYMVELIDPKEAEHLGWREPVVMVSNKQRGALFGEHNGIRALILWLKEVKA